MLTLRLIALAGVLSVATASLARAQDSAPAPPAEPEPKTAEPKAKATDPKSPEDTGADDGWINVESANSTAPHATSTTNRHPRVERNRPTWGRSAPAVDVSRVSGWEWIPVGLLQPRRIADVRDPRGAFRFLSPGGHRPQLDVAIGIQFAMLRYTPTQADAGWRFGLELYTAMFMRFDMEHETDLLATDGYYGLPLVFEFGEWVWHIGFNHTSSHLGDETQASSGLEPIDYLKEEAVSGITWMSPYGVRPYFEAGYALRRGHIDGPSGQKWWRLQGGIDWVPDATAYDWLPFTFGFNAESRQEVGWNITTTVHIAIYLWRGEHDQNIRFAFDWTHGRSFVHQFHDKRVNWWSLSFVGDF